ncbi:MAG: hypothetical protein ACE5LU_12965 [Anaerolineae bacterium]
MLGRLAREFKGATQFIEGVAQAALGLSLKGIAPEEGGQLLPGVGLARGDQIMAMPVLLVSPPGLTACDDR